MDAPHLVRLTVNGREVSEYVAPRTLLVDFLRERLSLTGTHVGCDTSQCGACTVHCNGLAIKSCTMLAVQAEGCAITTIEGLHPEGCHPLQVSFREEHALQCGFCTPGMVMAAAALLNETPAPTEADVREALEGNLCRCTGYHPIIAAVLTAARATRGGGRS